MSNARQHNPGGYGFTRCFGILFATAFVVGVGSYWLLHSILGQGRVFGGLFRMFLYHDQHPAQYIAVVAFFSAWLAALWGIRSRAIGWRWHLGLIGVLAAALLLSSAAGGMLWTFHDMQAGFFPPLERRIGMFAEGAIRGVGTGWLIVLLLFPFNVVTTFLAYAATYYFFQTSAIRGESSPHLRASA